MAAGKRLFSQPLTETTWFNAIWFQTTWFCAVLGRESLLPLTAALIALHLLLVPDRGRELQAAGSRGGRGHRRRCLPQRQRRLRFPQRCS